MQSSETAPNIPAPPSLERYAHILTASPAVDTSRLIYICPRWQKLYLYKESQCLFSCPVSTAKRGLGELEGSYQTPRGLHCISEIIGQGEPPGRIFKSRIAQDDCWHPNTAPSEDDLILSRILWLDGLEAGKNQGGQVDSKKRYIYLHGTNHEQDIGTPASAGCIRLLNKDIIELTDHWITPGSLCLIQDDDLPAARTA